MLRLSLYVSAGVMLLDNARSSCFHSECQRVLKAVLFSEQMTVRKKVSGFGSWCSRDLLPELLRFKLQVSPMGVLVIPITS